MAALPIGAAAHRPAVNKGPAAMRRRRRSVSKDPVAVRLHRSAAKIKAAVAVRASGRNRVMIEVALRPSADTIKAAAAVQDLDRNRVTIAVALRRSVDRGQVAGAIRPSDTNRDTTAVAVPPSTNRVPAVVIPRRWDGSALPSAADIGPGRRSDGRVMAARGDRSTASTAPTIVAARLPSGRIEVVRIGLVPVDSARRSNSAAAATSHLRNRASVHSADRWVPVTASAARASATTSAAGTAADIGNRPCLRAVVSIAAGNVP
jgi:hypothetical protein